MTKVNQIKLKLEDFRAINQAEIILDGITVVAGENGSGKSTISKFLYYIFRLANDYDNIISKNLQIKLRKYYYFLNDFAEFLNSSNKNSSTDNEIAVESNISIEDLIRGYHISFRDKDFWVDYIDKLLTIFQQQEDNYSYLGIDTTHRRSQLNRFSHILSDLVVVIDPAIHTIKDQLNLLKGDIVAEISLYIMDKNSLLLQYLRNEYEDLCNISQLPVRFLMQEYETPIIDSQGQSFIKPHSIRQVAYIDTPMSLGLEDTEIESWDDLNNIIKVQRKKLPYNTDLNRIISNDIIKGDTSFENDIFKQNAFTYTRSDGEEFNLLECATGIRSFAILQILLKNGFLNKYTLLVIDEPEAHLHPQWIIEYARLVVLLNKHVGVKFFIASHNPDMVSAIKYISEKENVHPSLNFYIAKPFEDTQQYNYHHLGIEIDEIFESFNIALDRINQYGGSI